MQQDSKPSIANQTLQGLKKILGDRLTKEVRPLGHGIKGIIASNQYHRPHRKLRLIGINGTKGKTTTAIFLGRLLNLAGIKTGYLSTAVINTYGDKSAEKQNPYKMTTLDSLVMFKCLHEMVENGCQWAVVEMSSEGLAQNRHWGLGGFDVTLFLNIFPEHIESHGSYEKYFEAKSKLFKNIKRRGIFIGNGDKDMREKTLKMWDTVPPEKRATCQKHMIEEGLDYIIEDTYKSMFKQLKIGDKTLQTHLIAGFEAKNLAFALKTLEVIYPERYDDIMRNPKPLEKIHGTPGRMEWVVWENQLVR